MNPDELSVQKLLILLERKGVQLEKERLEKNRVRYQLNGEERKGFFLKWLTNSNREMSGGNLRRDLRAFIERDNGNVDKVRFDNLIFVGDKSVFRKVICGRDGEYGGREMEYGMDFLPFGEPVRLEIVSFDTVLAREENISDTNIERYFFHSFVDETAVILNKNGEPTLRSFDSFSFLS